MTDDQLISAESRHSLHPYVSDHALSMLAAHRDGGWQEITGTLAFFDVSGFTRLTERLARVGRSGGEHITDVLTTVFTGLIDEVFRVGGDVLEFGGDAMVVLYDGAEHQRRAAVAATRMFGFMAQHGLIHTPLGDVRLRMSCGMASGTQAYHLVGVTRRALDGGRTGEYRDGSAGISRQRWRGLHRRSARRRTPAFVGHQCTRRNGEAAHGPGGDR